jgi:hypothetical protein
MKTLLLVALLMQAQRRPEPPMPADIDAAKEARLNEKVVFGNDILRVSEVKVPSGLKELTFAPEKTGFFVIGGSRVIWQTGPVVIRGDALHVEFWKPMQAKQAEPREGVMFENSLLRVRHVGRGEGGELKWLEKERVLLIKQGPHRMRVELKF